MNTNNVEKTAELFFKDINSSIVPQKMRGNIIGLFIGVNDYSFVGTKAIKDLDFAVNDARALFQVFLKYANADFERLGLLIDEEHCDDFTVEVSKIGCHEPSASQILKSLDLFSIIAKEDDLFILFFSGHGIYDERTKDTLLLTKDTVISDLVKTSLSIKYLIDKIKQIKSKTKLILIDACRTIEIEIRSIGSVSSLRNEFLSDMANLENNIYIMMSCSIGEISHGDPDLKMGIFTHHLIEVIESTSARDEEGNISLKDLFLFLQSAVANFSQRYTSQQTPDGNLIRNDVQDIHLLAKPEEHSSINREGERLIDLQESINGVLRSFDAQRKVNRLGKDYSLEVIIGNNKSMNFFPHGNESEWLISCSHLPINTNDIKSYPDYFIVEILNYRLRINSEGQIYYTERFTDSDKTLNLAIMTKSILDWMLYYHKICQYRQFQGTVGIKVLISNIRGFNLQISPQQDFYLRIPSDSLVLPENKHEIELFKSYESRLNHFMISSTDVLFSTMKEITQYIVHNFGYSRFGFIESYIGKLIQYTESFRIHGHKNENLLLKGIQFSDDIPTVSPLI